MLLLTVSLSPAAEQHIVFSFTNSSAYTDKEVYVWFRAGPGYDIKFKGEPNNIVLGKSYSLEELKKKEKEGKPLIVKHAVSGNIYISLGKPLADAKLDKDGVPTSNPGIHGADNGVDVRFDFMEFTYNPAPPDIADLSSMDQFAIPLNIQLKKNGKNLSGEGTYAGWRKNDKEAVTFLSKQVSPEGSNIVYDDKGNFIRVKGATAFPRLYHNPNPLNPEDAERSDSRSISHYFQSISEGQKQGRQLRIVGSFYDATNQSHHPYQYEAKLEPVETVDWAKVSAPDKKIGPWPSPFQWNLTLIGPLNDPQVPKSIIFPAFYQQAPDNPQAPLNYLVEAIYNGNPWYQINGGKVENQKNDAPGAAARDLFAALNLGYVNSEYKIKPEDTVDSSLAGKYIYELNTEQMTKLKIAFAAVNPFYNIYADAIHQMSDSCGYAYSDWNGNLKSKVGVTLSASHNGEVADELNIEILGSKIVAPPQPLKPATQPGPSTPARQDSEYMESVDSFLEN